MNQMFWLQKYFFSIIYKEKAELNLMIEKDRMRKAKENEIE